MTRADYNTLRGWTLPADERGEDDGYLVEYMDGGQANHKDHAGYISWSPKDVFDRAYRPTENMSFGLALEALKQGHRVARGGWNGKGMWLALVEACDYHALKGAAMTAVLGCAKLPWIGMKTADNGFVPWLASQTDMLANDWAIVGAA